MFVCVWTSPPAGHLQSLHHHHHHHYSWNINFIKTEQMKASVRSHMKTAAVNHTHHVTHTGSLIGHCEDWGGGGGGKTAGSHLLKLLTNCSRFYLLICHDLKIVVLKFNLWWIISFLWTCCWAAVCERWATNTAAPDSTDKCVSLVSCWVGDTL